jgi:hypothetical protein
MARDVKVGTSNQKKKGISMSMIRAIKKYQKHLQTLENIKYGRKAKHISFVYATKSPKQLARYILEEMK